MRQSANRHDDTASPLTAMLGDALAAGGAIVSRNPVIVGGSTAFLVTLFYVSANALWYQPQAHMDAFFATRALPALVVPGVDGDEHQDEIVAPVPVRRPDPTVEKVQGLLVGMRLYAGPVDGIAGPQTRKAIEEFQRLGGLRVSGEIDEQLVERLTRSRGRPSAEVTATVASEQRTKPASAADSTATAPASETVMKVQAGLKAFGHEAIEVDGAVGPKTRLAIREFQSLFGLPVSGEVDRALTEKMREIGLTD